MNLSIVIPAYNEEKRIGTTLERYLKAFPDVEFVIVPNGCRDRTLEVAESFRSRYPSRILIKNIPDRVGKGAAVYAGFKLAHGELVGFVDADGATDPMEYKKLVDAISDHDAAIASRWIAGSQVTNRSLVRKIVSRAFQVSVKLSLQLPFHDTQCGAKLFRRKVIDTIQPYLRVTNMAFDVEMLQATLKKGFRVVEVPTRWVDQSRSVILGSPWKILVNSFSMFFSLLSLRFRKFHVS